MTRSDLCGSARHWHHGIMLQLLEDFLNQTIRLNKIEAAIDVLFGAIADAADEDDAITTGYARWLKNPRRQSPGEPTPAG